MRSLNLRARRRAWSRLEQSDRAIAFGRLAHTPDGPLRSARIALEQRGHLADVRSEDRRDGRTWRAPWPRRQLPSARRRRAPAERRTRSPRSADRRSVPRHVRPTRRARDDRVAAFEQRLELVPALADLAFLVLRQRETPRTQASPRRAEARRSRWWRGRTLPAPARNAPSAVRRSRRARSAPTDDQNPPTLVLVRIAVGLGQRMLPQPGAVERGRFGQLLIRAPRPSRRGRRSRALRPAPSAR